MAKVLIVDDDNRQCMNLGFALSSRGHQIELATDGHKALDIGAGFRPDVLLADWMLQGALDGIGVSEALRAVHPSTHTVLVTGLASPELRKKALESRIFGFFEKPLSTEKVLAAIDKAREIPPLPVKQRLGLLEFGPDGGILHVNDRARELLRLPEELTEEHRLSNVLSYRSNVAVDSANGDWIRVSPHDDPRTLLHGFVKGKPTGRRHLLLLGEDEEPLRESSVVLAHVARGSDVTAGSLPGSLLVVDRDPLQRKLTVSQVESLTYRVHTAADAEEALRVLRADRGVGVVLIDYETGGGARGTPECVSRIREENPQATLVGTSAGARQREFAAAGVPLFLLKPVTAPALREVTGG